MLDGVCYPWLPSIFLVGEWVCAEVRFAEFRASLCSPGYIPELLPIYTICPAMPYDHCILIHRVYIEGKHNSRFNMLDHKTLQVTIIFTLQLYTLIMTSSLLTGISKL